MESSWLSSIYFMRVLEWCYGVIMAEFYVFCEVFYKDIMAELYVFCEVFKKMLWSHNGWVLCILIGFFRKTLWSYYGWVLCILRGFLAKILWSHYSWVLKLVHSNYMILTWDRTMTIWFGFLDRYTKDTRVRRRVRVSEKELRVSVQMLRCSIYVCVHMRQAWELELVKHSKWGHHVCDSEMSCGNQ